MCFARLWFGLVRIFLGISLFLPARVTAQTDYFNTEANRPVRIEDAYPLERYAFELQLSPLRLSRFNGGEYEVQIDPKISYGILPRTYIELGLPLEYADRGDEGGTFGFAGLDFTAFYNLNTETLSLPAFALAGALLIPLGSQAPGHVYPSFTTIMTRSFRFGRIHVNGQYTFGPASDDDDGDSGSPSRWLAGVAIDKTLPLKSALLAMDVYLEEPIANNQDLRLVAEAGARYQLNPGFTIDLGIGRTLTALEGWHLNFGVSRAFAIRSLMPAPRR